MWRGKNVRGRAKIKRVRAEFGLGPRRDNSKSSIDYEALRRAVAQTARQARASGESNARIRKYILDVLSGKTPR